MDKTTTLLLIDQDTSDTAISAFAESAARTDTHLGCLLIGGSLHTPGHAGGFAFYGALDIPEDWADRLRDARKAQETRVGQIEQILARADVSGDVQSAYGPLTELREHVALRARVCDMACISPNLRDDPGLFREAALGVLLKSPVGLIVNTKMIVQPDRVFLAWDSSEASARAAHVALPHLRAANEVVIGCFDPDASRMHDGADPGAEVATWLSRHGCNITLSQYPSGGQEIGQCIQDRARETGAELIVMGAYGHARLRQAVFGGTTRSLMDQIDTPVLFAH